MSDAIRWVLVLAALVLIGTLVWHRLYQKPERTVHRGINYVAYGPEEYAKPEVEQDLRRLQALGVRWVAIVVTWYQADASATSIAPDLQRSPTDAAVAHVLREIRRLGMNAFLRPMVDLLDGTWRGEIASPGEREWAAWFESYGRFITQYAQLAQREGAALFSVGVELEKTVGHKAAWRRLIRRVREVYRGEIIYSANWDGYQTVPFWYALDYVGIDAYFELDITASSLPTVGGFVAAWQPWVAQLDRFAQGVEKPILLTEIGVRSVRGNSRRPWDWTLDAPLSLQEQAHYYEAAFRVFWDRPWLAGLYWWAWLPFSAHGGPDDLTYTPGGKPAEQVLKRWYSR
jgi:hypothetical protein